MRTTHSHEMDLRGVSRERARELITELASTPLLPVLGYTKFVEAVIAGGPEVNWLAYSIAVTVVWVFADDLKRRAEDLGDAAQDAVGTDE